MNPLVGVLVLLLIISASGNAFLFHSRDKAIERAAGFEQANGTLAAGVTACSTSVEALAKAGKKRHDDMMESLNKELPRIKGLQHDALTALQARPINPNDLCGSLLNELRVRIKQEKAIK